MSKVNGLYMDEREAAEEVILGLRDDVWTYRSEGDYPMWLHCETELEKAESAYLKKYGEEVPA